MRALLIAASTIALVGAGGFRALAAQEPDMDPLFDFTTASEVDAAIVNDGVMGGRSSSTFEVDGAGFAVFSGTVSLENNGGFASVRLPIPARAMAGATHLVLRVRGDGQRYQARLRPGRRYDGIAFAASFATTANEWVTVEMPLDEFQPSFRGYRPPGVGPLDPADVGQVGIMLTDKQAGPFRLEIEAVGVRGATEPTSTS